MVRVNTLYRVSTVGQVDHDDIPMQRLSCHDFVATQPDWEITREFYEKGVSGYKIKTEKRDAITQLKAEALAGNFDVLLVFMFDRLGRRDDETPFVVQWFVAHGIRVWSVKEGEQRFDSHVDKLLNYIRFWQASGESEKTAIRVRAKQQQMVLAGEYRGGLIPFGYDAVYQGRVNKKNQPVRDLVINEHEAAIKREVYRKIVDEGYGTNRIANWLNEMGIKTKRGTTLWRATSVRAMIGNPIDRGQMHLGDTLSEPIDALRIIDDYHFYEAQRIIQERGKENARHRSVPLRTDSGLLTGLLYCAHCGERLTINHCRKVNKTADGSVTYLWDVYRCYRKINSRKTCAGPSTYTVKKVDDAVLKIVREFFARIRQMPEASKLSLVLRREDDLQAAALRDAEAKIEKLSKGVEALEAETLKILVGDSALDMDTVSQMLTKQKAALQAAQEDYQRLNESFKDKAAQMNEKRQQLQQQLQWAEVFDAAPMASKKMILAQIIDRIEVGRDYEIHVKLRVSAEQFMNPDGIEDQALSS